MMVVVVEMLMLGGVAVDAPYRKRHGCNLLCAMAGKISLDVRRHFHRRDIFIYEVIALYLSDLLLLPLGNLKNL